MAKEPEAAEGGATPKKKSKMLLVIILGMAVLLLGGGGFFAYTQLLKAPAVDAENPEGPAPAGAKKPEEVGGAMYALDPFIVNLSDAKGKRYLKVKVEIELDNEEAVAIAEKYKAKMRDMVIMMLTSLTFEEVMTPEGKMRVKDELLERFSRIMKPAKIRDIYFTEFVVQ